MILPEIFLNTPLKMKGWSAPEIHEPVSTEGLLEPHQGTDLVERKAAGKTRHGVMWHWTWKDTITPRFPIVDPGAEGTILDRLPPRSNP